MDIFVFVLNAICITIVFQRSYISDIYTYNIKKILIISIIIIDIIFFISNICYKIGVNNGAMAVYRNKTTLEITYQNGKAIDSTIIFKQKENKL